MSVDTERRPTLRSARARCMMKKFILDLLGGWLWCRYEDMSHGGRSNYLVRGDSWVISTSVLPDTITVSSRHRNTSCSVCIDSYI